MDTRDLSQAYKDDESVKFLEDPDVSEKLKNCRKFSDVNPSEYDAIFYVGGKALVSTRWHRDSPIQIANVAQGTDRSLTSQRITKMETLFQR